MPPTRPDLSPYIVHLTRDYTPPGGVATNARDNLLSILRDHCIEARNPYGVAVRHLEAIGCTGPAFMDSQKVACFSETPLDFLRRLVDPGVWRACRLRPYGLAFPREYMLDMGANPVGYLNTFPGTTGFEWPVRAVNALIDEAALDQHGKPDPARWQASHIAKITPILETIGEWQTGRMGAKRAKDFSWEREWRHRGDFYFDPLKVEAIIVPAGEADSFRREVEALDADISWLVAEGLVGFFEIDPMAATPEPAV